MESLACENSWIAVTIYQPNGQGDCALIRRSTHQSPRYYSHVSKATRNRLFYLFACAGYHVMPLHFSMPEGQLSYYWIKNSPAKNEITAEGAGEAPYPVVPSIEDTADTNSSNVFSSWLKAFSSRINSLLFL